MNEMNELEQAETDCLRSPDRFKSLLPRPGNQTTSLHCNFPSASLSAFSINSSAKFAEL